MTTATQSNADEFEARIRAWLTPHKLRNAFAYLGGLPMAVVGVTVRDRMGKSRKREEYPVYRTWGIHMDAWRGLAEIIARIVALSPKDVLEIAIRFRIPCERPDPIYYFTIGYYEDLRFSADDYERSQDR